MAMKGPYDLPRGRDDFQDGLYNYTKSSVKFKTDKIKLQREIVY